MRGLEQHTGCLRKRTYLLSVSPADLSNLTSQKSQRGNPDWTLLDPQERLEPLPSYLACPPQDWAVARGPGGVRTVFVPPYNTLVRMGPS